jgi:cytoskeletal protein RodZ
VTNRPAPGHSPRSGAHRPRRPLWHDILPLAVVAVAVIALVVGIFELKDSVLGGTSAATTSNGPSDDNGAPAPTTPTSSRTASATATSTAGASATTSATVSHSTRISVYNATSHTGLARGATTKLSGAGWTRATTGGNKTEYTGSTTVFYPSSSLRATARAVAADLGGYAVEQSTQYGSSGLTVILGSDYQS